MVGRDVPSRGKDRWFLVCFGRDWLLAWLGMRPSLEVLLRLFELCGLFI